MKNVIPFLRNTTMFSKQSNPSNTEKKNVFVDIDNTKSTTTGMSNADAQPIPQKIAKVNKLYDSNNYIITYWTARGVKTHIDWTELTKTQLSEWGAKYHHLHLTKPPFDILIDDKAINSLWDWSPSSFNEVLSPGYNKLLHL